MMIFLLSFAVGFLIVCVAYQHFTIKRLTGDYKIREEILESIIKTNESTCDIQDEMIKRLLEKMQTGVKVSEKD